MHDSEGLAEVLRAYPRDCQPSSIVDLRSAGGFSGARLWKLETPRGTAYLRRWPAEHPPVERLEFIQAVLWHVAQEGFRLVPVPYETSRHAGYVRHAGHLWELGPWMPGRADFREHPTRARLEAALAALAEFHQAAASFPLPEKLGHAPAVAERQARLERLISGGAEAIARRVEPDPWPELGLRARELFRLFWAAAPGVRALLHGASQLPPVPIQPCIRDIWHDHVLFEGPQVSGLIDFGSMRPESVASDLSRLLGSLAGDDGELWQAGLGAYQEIRPLSPDELQLVAALDRSSVLLSGLQWLEWIYVEGRQFDDQGAVLARLDENMNRLSRAVKLV